MCRGRCRGRGRGWGLVKWCGVGWAGVGSGLGSGLW